MATYATPGEVLPGASLPLPTVVSADDGEHAYKPVAYARHGWNGFHIPAFDASTMERLATDLTVAYAVMVRSGDENAEYATTFTRGATGWLEVSRNGNADPEVWDVPTVTLEDGTVAHYAGNGWCWSADLGAEL